MIGKADFLVEKRNKPLLLAKAGQRFSAFYACLFLRNLTSMILRSFPDATIGVING